MRNFLWIIFQIRILNNHDIPCCLCQAASDCCAFSPVLTVKDKSVNFSVFFKLTQYFF